MILSNCVLSAVSLIQKVSPFQEFDCKCIRSLCVFSKRSLKRSGCTDRDRNPPEGSEAASCSLCVLRGSRWKYVCFSDPAMPPLLFDMNDKAELVDLAGSTEPEHVLAQGECAMAMMKWRMRHAEHSLTHLNLSGAGVVQGTHLFEPTAVARL